jgi:hypothetical protein
MILFFAVIALVIFILTSKRLALVSSIAFFISEFISTRSVETFSYEAAVISMMILNFSVFSIAVIEYKKHHTDLSRSLMWLYLGFLAVTGSYAFQTTAMQGYILVGMSVLELILLASLDGCRSVWTDFRLTADTIRNGSYRQRRHSHREG